jgi:(p)ppGpp synthase/HD superfamily hydrolase
MKENTMNEFVTEAMYYGINQHQQCGCMYGDKPYALHLQQVYAYAYKFLHLIPEQFADTVLAATWTHDVIEDCHLTYNDVKNALNKEVADLVYDVSNELGKNRKERAQKTYPKIQANKLAIFLKLCDRLANTLASQKNNSSMLKKYKQEYPEFRATFYPHSEEYKELWDVLDSANEWVNS